MAIELTKNVGTLTTVKSSAGTVRTINDKLGESISAKDCGAKGDSVTTDGSAFTTLNTSTIGLRTIPDGDYKLTSTWTPVQTDVRYTTDPKATFPNSKPDFATIVPTQIGPIWSLDVTSKTYGSEWAGYGNIFQTASLCRSQVATVPVVGVFGEAFGDAPNTHTWGGNFVSYASGTGASAIATELNCGILSAGATAYGLVIASAGVGQVENAIQMQTNGTACTFKNGIVFNYFDQGCVTGNLLYITGRGTDTCASFLAASGIRATGAEINLPSFVVGATPVGVANRLSVLGATSGSDVILLSSGTDTNSNITISGKGTGGVNLFSGSGRKFSVNNSGIGFYGTNPVAKPTITGSYAANAGAILNNLIVALDNMGLVTNGTTA